MDEHPIDEHPIDEHPIDEHPIDEHPIDEHPIDEHPIDEHPIDEHPIDEHPIDEHPIAGRVPAVLDPVDQAWKYVEVRRLLLYLEHSIQTGLQWTVFEPNGPQLWAAVRRSVEDFLTTQWQDGALLGGQAQEAFFVRCDATTMTQDDLDNGRLVLEIGVAPVRPAEFVVFRIGQWTALTPTPPCP